MLMENKLGMTQWNLPRPRDNAVETAAALGLACVHLELGDRKKGYPMADKALQAKMLSDARRLRVALPSLAINGLCATGFTHPVSDERRQAAKEMLATGIETAARMGVPSVSIPSFGDNAVDGDESYAYTVEGLRAACRLGEQYGLCVYTENVLDVPALARLWRDVNEPNLRLLFDTQNYAYCGKPYARTVYTGWRAYLGDFLHLKDGRGAMGNCPLGKGNGGFEEIWRDILSDGFSGWFILENEYPTREALIAEINGLRSARMELS